MNQSRLNRGDFIRAQGAIRRAIVAFGVGLVVLLTASAQDPQVRARLQVPDPLWAGQKVTLVVELLAPGYFSSAASFDLPNPSGLLLLAPADHPLVSGETIEGAYYTVQRHELAVYPTTAGTHTIPPFRVRFSYKHAPLDHDSVTAAVTTPSLSLGVMAPPGAEGLGQVISARNLRVVEEWKPATDKAAVRVGDAFTRTVTFSAPDVPAMMFPPFPAGQIDGLGVYPQPPKVIDRNDRGARWAERRDSVTYVCQRPGRFTLPAARLTWFDLDAQKLQVIDLPAHTWEVAANSSEEVSAVPAQERKIGWKGIAAAGAGVALGFAAFKWHASCRRWLAAVLAPLRPVHLQPLNPRASAPGVPAPTNSEK